MKTGFPIIFVLAFSVLFLISCSGDNAGVVMPEVSNPALANGSDQNTPASRQLWGFYDVSLNTVTGETEIVPLRAVEFTANVTRFLQPPAGKLKNLGIKVIDTSQYLDSGLIDVDVTLTHPFPGLDTYTGFDVMGVFIHNGDTSSQYDGSVLIGLTGDSGRLLNADGYTRWYNPSEFPAKSMFGYIEGALGNKGMNFTATVNGYKYFCDGLGNADALADFLHSPDILDSRGMFRSTSANTRRYELQFPMDSGSPVLTFQYAVVANWEPPVPDPPQNVPGDFPPGANSHEPFYLTVEDNGSTLYYSGGTGGGTLRVKAELFDWGAAINSTGILGEFSQVIIESTNANIPGGFYPLPPDEVEPYLQPGTPISSVAELELEGVVPTGPEDVEFLVIVESKEGDSFDQGFGVPVPDSTLASYFRFSIPIGTNPCANFDVTGANPSPGESGESYTGFEVTGNNFQDGVNLAVDIVDGMDIVVSATSVYLEDIHTITCDFDFCGVLPGDFDLRVTNGCDPVSYSSIPYTIDPDPLKNISLRDGVQIADLSVCETTGEPYVIFADNQLWVYGEDYSSGEYKISSATNRICAQKTIFIDPNYVTEATLVSTSDYRAWVWWREPNQLHNPGSYTGTMIDVMGVYGNTRHYYVENCSSFLGMIRRNIGYPNGGYLSNYTGIGVGTGVVNMNAVKGVDTSRQLTDMPFPQASWFYLLEGAPDYSVERLAYMGLSSNHYFNAAGTYLSGPGDGSNQLNNPLDIADDADSHVFILDIKSTGQPVVKIYDSDMNYLGEVGDSVTISGTPLRLDTDDSDGEVHVAHTNGVSVFRVCELPF
ncbi:MAG: hypothetical protein ABIC40_04825 [bacterium]